LTVKKGLTKDKLTDFIKKNEVPRPCKDYDIKIDFLDTRKYNTPVIKINNLSFSYGDKKILDNVTLGLGMDSRVTLVGLNGCGKSTLIKLIKGELKPTDGDIFIQHGIKIGYYNQHFDQQLPFDKTPIEFLQDYAPSPELIGKDINKYEIVRNYLGKIKLESSAHNKLISELSGGQKARVAFVKLIFERPQILLLDEPTNHLDIETVETLIESLETFEGGILLITHEPEMIERLSNQIWMLNKNTQKIITNIESYDQYCNIILES
jgi:ATPase subunit of ABC transporter with duplicated ATPase domains